MAGINLLPIDLSPSRGSVKFASILKKIIFMMTGVFVLLSLAGIIVIFLLSSQLQDVVNKENQTKQQIQSLETTEQQLFLVKDRIDKIQTALNNPNAANGFEKVDALVSNLPPDVSVNSVDISQTDSTFTVVSQTSLGMENFINSVVTSGAYKKLTLTNFVYEKEAGYTITLEGS